MRLAYDLIAWTQRLLVSGELAKAEPKRLHYRLMHVAARLAFHARGARLHLQATWPWVRDLAAAFVRLKALSAGRLTRRPRPREEHPDDRRSRPAEACPRTTACDRHDRSATASTRPPDVSHLTAALPTHPTLTSHNPVHDPG